MARFECKCGSILSNSLIPNEIEYRAYSGIEWDKILEKDTINTLKIPSPKLDVWRCPNCERIYVFASDGKVLKRYKLEED